MLGLAKRHNGTHPIIKIVDHHNDLEELKRRDLTEYLSNLGISFKKSGNGWVALCPLHEETNPSFNVKQVEGGIWLWNCFGCGLGGSVIDYVMKKEGVETGEAIRRLKESEDRSQKTAEQSFRAEVRKTLPTVLHQRLLDKTCEYYQHTFHDDLRARNYLSEIRGLIDPKLYEIFRIGYSNGTIFKTVTEEGEYGDALRGLGILTSANREFFEGCVVFPLLDEEGRVVSFYGRRLQGQGANHLYLKGPHRGLFNGPSLKLYPEIILTESIIDSLSLYQAGFKNTIPLYGLNGLTSDHLMGFKRNNTSQIILLMDGDEAGKSGALRLKEKLEELGTPTRIANLPDGEDPNSFLKKHTKEEMEKILYPEIRLVSLKRDDGRWRRDERRLIEDGFCVQYTSRTYELRGIEQNSARHLKANIKAISNHRFTIDTIDLYNSRARNYLTREIALFYSVEADLIEQDIEKLIIECQEYLKKVHSRQSMVHRITEQEEKEALRLAKDPKLTERITQDLSTLGLVGEDTNKLLLYLSMSSRKMSDPLSVLILSGSGAGKSILQDKVLSLCPEEDLIKLTSLTKQALFYKDALSMVHKVLAIEEETGAEDASYPIRSLISSKKIVIESTIRDPHTGKMTTMTNEVLGPTAVMKSTTQPKQDQETKSRFLTVSMDETREQTEKILALQRESESLEGLLKKLEQSEIVKAHQNFQRLLQAIEVVIPKEIELSWSMKALMARRDHPKYLSVVKAITFIHQFQRPVKEIEHNGKIIKVIETEKSDIALANRLAEKLLSQNLQELSEPGETLLHHLEKMKEAKILEGRPAGKIIFTRREIRETLLWTDYQVRTYLKELVDLEYVIALGGRQGSLIRYKILQDLIVPTGQDLIVPTGQDLIVPEGIVPAGQTHRILTLSTKFVKPRETS
ncbi:MAG: toprim domain-containing protein [Chlamydiae bacterium]|nr:toprim domain-containing protein [Chlamydiota bacterium]